MSLGGSALGAGVPITTPQFYSAGTTCDLTQTLHYLRHTYPSSPLHGIGFSLGASVLSNYLCTTSNHSLLSSGLLIATPWNLPAMSIKLESHWLISRIYSTAMAQNLLRVFFSHYDANPGIWEDEGKAGVNVEGWNKCLEGLKVLRKRGKGVRLKEVDEFMVSKIGGPRGEGLWPFKGADEYYDWAGSYNKVKGIKR